MLGDPLLDWLDLYGSQHGFDRDDSPESGYLPETCFTTFLTRKGAEFEAAVIELIDNRLGALGLEPSIRVAEQPGDIELVTCAERTTALLQAQVPIVYQAVLRDEELRLYGAPDLLIRSDVLQALFDALELPVLEDVGNLLGPSAKPYYVVDIKFTTLHLNASWELGNEGSAPAYKAQLALNNFLLGEVQGVRPPAGLLLGRGWKKGNDRSHSCLDRLAKVSIVQAQHRRPEIDWLEHGFEAVDWLKRLRAEGDTWSCMPPSNPLLRPNMKHIEDAPWHQAKKRIAGANGELTMLWYVGTDLRDAAAAQNLQIDWKHPEFDLEELLRLDPTGHLWDRKANCCKERGAKLAQILDVNRLESETLITPVRVDSAREQWDVPGRLEFFVDFETCSDLDDDFSQLPLKNGQALIFMIGCGHFDESGVWRFRVFRARKLDAESEGEILIQWLKYMDEVSSNSPECSEEPIVFHWSPAETSTLTTAYNSAAQRHPNLKPVNWFDFLNLVVKPTGTSCLAVKGALGFGLKAIGKALYSQGKIATSWQDGPTDGLGAMVGAWWCYREAEQRGCLVQDVCTPDRDGAPGRALMREIETYNEIDCKVMAEIICYLRLHH